MSAVAAPPEAPGAARHAGPGPQGAGMDPAARLHQNGHWHPSPFEAPGEEGGAAEREPVHAEPVAAEPPLPAEQQHQQSQLAGPPPVPQAVAAAYNRQQLQQAVAVRAQPVAAPGRGPDSTPRTPAEPGPQLYRAPSASDSPQRMALHRPPPQHQRQQPPHQPSPSLQPQHQHPQQEPADLEAQQLTPPESSPVLTEVAAAMWRHHLQSGAAAQGLAGLDPEMLALGGDVDGPGAPLSSMHHLLGEPPAGDPEPPAAPAGSWPSPCASASPGAAEAQGAADDSHAAASDALAELQPIAAMIEATLYPRLSALDEKVAVMYATLKRKFDEDAERMDARIRSMEEKVDYVIQLIAEGALHRAGRGVHADAEEHRLASRRVSANGGGLSAGRGPPPPQPPQPQQPGLPQDGDGVLRKPYLGNPFGGSAFDPAASGHLPPKRRSPTREKPERDRKHQQGQQQQGQQQQQQHVQRVVPLNRGTGFGDDRAPRAAGGSVIPLAQPSAGGGMANGTVLPGGHPVRPVVPGQLGACASTPYEGAQWANGPGVEKLQQLWLQQQLMACTQFQMPGVNLLPWNGNSRAISALQQQQQQQQQPPVTPTVSAAAAASHSAGDRLGGGRVPQAQVDAQQHKQLLAEMQLKAREAQALHAALPAANLGAAH